MDVTNTRNRRRDDAGAGKAKSPDQVVFSALLPTTWQPAGRNKVSCSEAEAQ
ncbi:hypothetical protein IMZ48_15460 [Candidatus Bathyarchaeota archaeon]|nr:hypothetical protein [Candidatus Bathyarchaeota archaeon]